MEQGDTTGAMPTLIESIGRQSMLDRPADIVRRLGDRLPRRITERAQAVLGHPVHPMFTDLPIGFWTSAWALDLLPGRAGTAVAARRLLGLGLLSAVPTVVTGLGDAAELERRDGRIAALHAGLNIAATTAFAWSWLLRRQETTARARMLCQVGAILATGAGALGAHLALGGQPAPADGQPAPADGQPAPEHGESRQV
jgi:uncharacterized membrane protein